MTVMDPEPEPSDEDLENLLEIPVENEIQPEPAVEATEPQTFTDPALALISELLNETSSRNIFFSKKLVEFTSNELLSAHSSTHEVLLGFKAHPRGPTFNEFVPADVVMNFCLDLWNAIVIREEVFE